MSALRNVFGGCMSDRTQETVKLQKLRFGVPLSIALKSGDLPGPLVDLLVYIAKEGVMTVDIFRRPGNPTDAQRIVKRLAEGKPVAFQNYNFYTLASVVKKFLLKIPGGILGEEGEACLLNVLDLDNRLDQYSAIRQFISSLSDTHQQLLSLVFGTWFRVVCHCDVNLMTTEALSLSVTGSIFHTCADDLVRIEKACQVMQLLVENYGVSNLFGDGNIRYFTEMTRTGIHVREKFRYEFIYPPSDVTPREVSMRWFVMVIQDEAHKLGFDVKRDAATADTFYDLPPGTLLSQEVHEQGHDDDDDDDVLSPLATAITSTSTAATTSTTDSQLIANVTTASAPTVSMVPSPEVSKRPKSLEDNLNDSSPFVYQNKSLSRFNSVKRKQLERMRQRSDWFLGPDGQDRPPAIDLSKSFQQNCIINVDDRPKNGGGGGGGTLCVKSSSEGAVLDIIGSDADSVFTDTTSRSESPVSEPITSHKSRRRHRSHEVIRTDAADGLVDDASAAAAATPERRRERAITDDDLTESDVKYFVVEHCYGQAR